VDLSYQQRQQYGEKIKNGNDDGADACLVDPFIAEIPFNPGARLKLSPASRGETSLLKRNDPLRFCSLTSRQATGYALAVGFDEMPKAPEQTPF
jgi:hypothetical protein